MLYNFQKMDIQIILLLSPKDNAQQLQQKFYKNKSSSSNFLSFGSLKSEHQDTRIDDEHAISEGIKTIE